jgi:radical SAM-linked protein
MRVSFGPPLPLGYVSQAEYLDFQLESPLEKNHLVSLNENLPPGLHIVSSRIVLGRGESLVQLINMATYSVQLDSVKSELPSQIERLFAEKQLKITRRKQDEVKELSLGHLLHELRLEDDTINMALGVASEGYIRPSEVLIFGLGYSFQDAMSLIYKRTGQYLIQGVHKVDPLDIA